MTVLLKRASDGPTDEEFMDVSYYFHDGKFTERTRVHFFKVAKNCAYPCVIPRSEKLQKNRRYSV